MTGDYRDYFDQLGRAIGDGSPLPAPQAPKHLAKRVRIRSDVAQSLSAEQLDVVTARLWRPSISSLRPTFFRISTTRS